VNEVTIEDLPTQPDDVLRFPDFILGAMARRGIGSIEASFGNDSPQPPALLPWHYFSRTTHAVETVAEIRQDYFRTILARFATFSGISPYSGHTLLALRWPVGGSLVTHRFSIFLCNEPTMAFWIRIYLYCIDGIYPNRK
jgi:hypothetical protein